MKLSLRHCTIYHYDSAVSDSYNDARLRPVSDDSQHCESFKLEIEPAVPKVLKRLDFFTNEVFHFEVMEPHEALSITAESVVETFADNRDLAAASARSELVGLKEDERFYDFMNGSERVPLSTMILHESRELLDGTEDVGECARRTMRFVFENFDYAPGATDVGTPLHEAFTARRGVCQDFAHVMIGLCRGSGIPARYVSGYFYVDRPALGTVDDNSASHAWVECFLPGIGWVGYDPTHDRTVSERYVKVAVGRDYSDVRPISGTFRGEANARLEVSVEVSKLRG